MKWFSWGRRKKEGKDEDYEKIINFIIIITTTTTTAAYILLEVLADALAQCHKHRLNVDVVLAAALEEGHLVLGRQSGPLFLVDDAQRRVGVALVPH